MRPTDEVPPLPIDLALESFIDDLLVERGSFMDAPIPTGLSDLDGLLGGGLRRQRLTLIAGPAGVGTSTLAVNLATHAAVQRGLGAVVVTTQRDRDVVFSRVISSLARVSHTRVWSADLGDRDRERIRAVREVIACAPLFVSVELSASATPLDVGSHLEKLLAHDVTLMVVDGGAFVGRGRADLVRILKMLAVTHGVSVVFAAPAVGVFPWNFERPRVMDYLHDYEGVDDLLDLVILIDRDDLWSVETTRAGEADLHVVKHRHAPERVIAALFQGHYSRFVDLTHQVR